MNINVSFRHMDASPALLEYATSKLERICEKYVSGKVSADVTFTVEKHRHIANFTLSIRNLTVRGVEKTDDMYSSVDLALDKIEKQLRRHKDRIRDHQPSNSEARMFRIGVLSNPDQQEDSYDELEDFDSDYALYPPPESKEEPEQRTVRSLGEVRFLKQGEYEAKTLTIDEAVLQLDLLTDREFYVFNEPEMDSICVVYRRKDGNIGLLAGGNK